MQTGPDIYINNNKKKQYMQSSLEAIFNFFNV